MKNFHHLPEKLPPTILTIFGATGDLSAEYLLPALHHMDMEGLLPDNFRLVCVGRREFTTDEYLDFVVKKSKYLKNLSKGKARKHFLKHLTYFQGDFEKPESFKNLAVLLEDKDAKQHECYNRLYYFATSPQLFAQIANILKTSGLLMSCSKHSRQTRVLVEKPFGFNLESAQALNKLLLKYFSEEQIYRIDHYVGKETVQNLIVARFGNSIFEPLWNKEFVDHVEISVLYKDGVKRRAEFYNQTGALKDIVQNHALQMLALILMDEPKELTAEFIRDEKVKILSALQPLSQKTVNSFLLKGQYAGFSKELGKKTETETYVALKTFVNTVRWQNVPIYIRTGKALSKTVTEISIHFKELKRCLFKGCAGNVLTFRIQPDEAVHLQINNKIPGFGIHLHQSKLEFSYGAEFKGEIPGAYERLLLDFMQGDQRLFIRSDEIEAAWKYIDSITAAWKNLSLYLYSQGSSGPKEAAEFIEKDLREWRTN